VILPKTNIKHRLRGDCVFVEHNTLWSPWKYCSNTIGADKVGQTTKSSQLGRAFKPV